MYVIMCGETVVISRLLCVGDFCRNLGYCVWGDSCVASGIVCGEEVGYIYGTFVGRQVCCVRLLCVGRQF